MRQFDIHECRALQRVLIEVRVNGLLDTVCVWSGGRHRYDFRQRGAGLHMDCEFAVPLDHADVGNERAG
jgi:hypothetical protein